MVMPEKIQRDPWMAASRKSCLLIDAVYLQGNDASTEALVYTPHVFPGAGSASCLAVSAGLSL